MQIVFRQIFNESKESYVRKKFERDFQRLAGLGANLDDAEINKQIAGLINRQLGNPVPIARPDSIFEITAEQEPQIEARKRCALATLFRESPLVDGETVEEDLFTFLQQPFGNLPANTAVLRRTTNMAEIFYLFDDVQVLAGALQFIDPEPVPHTTAAPPRHALKAGFNIKGIAKDLGSGLVSGIGGKIGGVIFDAIFPPGVPDYFDEVYKEIGKIVKAEVDGNTITQINGRINGIVAWMKGTYKPRKEANVPRKELLQMVTEQVNVIYREGAYTLMEPRFAKPGFSVFMIVAGVHLALMQEQALVDPKEPDPAKSSFAISVKLNAQTYADFLKKTFDELIEDRKKLVELAYDPMIFDNDTPPKDRYRFHDTFTGTRGNPHEQYMDKDKKNHTGKEEAEADRQSYLPGVIDKLTNDLGNPMNIAGQWLKLTTKPIP